MLPTRTRFNTKARTLAVALTLVLAAGCASQADTAMKDKKNMAQVHMGHVTTGWKDTPGGKGLLPTAMAEADIAVFHAGLAAKKLGDLGWMKTHAAHVAHAMDPASTGGKGPGMGYGVIKAAGGAAKHIGFAAASKDASDNVKLHANHVSASAENTVERAKEILALTKKVQTAGTAAEAASLTMQINTLAGQLAAGVDANGDGKITWVKGEGGLNAANSHMNFMRKGEGLS